MAPKARRGLRCGRTAATECRPRTVLADGFMKGVTHEVCITLSQNAADVVDCILTHVYIYLCTPPSTGAASCHQSTEEFMYTLSLGERLLVVG